MACALSSISPVGMSIAGTMSGLSKDLGGAPLVLPSFGTPMGRVMGEMSSADTTRDE